MASEQSSLSAPEDRTSLCTANDGDAVIGRAFRLLRVFKAGSAELTLDELTTRSELPRSTTHRLVHQLVAQGVLERTRRGWRLGVELFELGQMVPRPQRLRDVALGYMEDLYEATRQTIQLAVLDDDDVLYVEIICGHQKAPTPSRRGGRMSAHCTALGKALLAFSGDAGQGWTKNNLPLARRTANTLTDPRSLLRELGEVRRLGLAYDREEAAPGLVCVAAPVLARDGAARAALSVSMASANSALTPLQAAPPLRATARALSRELGRFG